MSYVLQIWEQPLARAWPDKVKEAVANVERLHGISSGQNPKFIEFARRLTARFPCITSPASPGTHPEDEADAWSDGPLDGKTQEPVYGIGLNTDMPDAQWPLVINHVLDTARALGLSVFDDQAGEFHYANGHILDANGRMRPRVATRGLGPAAGDMPPCEALLDLFCLRLAPLFARHGFVLDTQAPVNRQRDWIERKFIARRATGWHQFTVNISDRRPAYVAFYVDIASCFSAVSRFRQYVIHEGSPPPEAPDLSTSFLRQNAWLNDTLGMAAGDPGHSIATRMHDLDRIAAHFTEQAETRLLPLLRCYERIEDLNTILNPEPLPVSLFFPGYYKYASDHLAAAYLAGDPRIEILCKLFHDKTVGAGEDATQKPLKGLCALIEYIRLNPGARRRFL